MVFWILVSVLTAVTAAFLILPALFGGERHVPAGDHDVEVYRDQLDEISRDEKNGLIAGEEAGFARAEVARRLLAAARTAGASATERAPMARRLAFLFALLCLPAMALPFYLRTGSPGMPDQPLAARLADPGNDMNILIARAERHLETNPGDGAGWDLLAPIYVRQGRFEDARNAFTQAIALLGPTPERYGGLAESIIALSGGTVTPEAQEVLRRSLAINKDDPRSEFYLALALEQEGKTAEALDAFRSMAAGAPKDAPWLPLVNEHIAMLGGAGEAPPGDPDAAAVAAAGAMEAGDRAEMIRGMVDSLAERMKTEPENFEGWMRLVRSYAVLDDRARAADALRQGLKAFPADGEQGRQLVALGREFGIDPAAEGASP
ncbi:c-type cytochrome biogenesis protein CcmI [Ensifer soli]|uniref:c-type cytochrome biogenesis protein CcmI n=1 Tax=Ciceribacter sp. sgz301302 TaxID=3342379 RepID=UPI0035BB289B